MKFIDIYNTSRERLAANDSQLNDSISPASWTIYIWEAYNSILMDLQAHAPREATVESMDITWPAGEQTFDLPSNLRDMIFYQIIQINEAGVPSQEFVGYFETRNRLRISPGYTAFNMNLRLYFLPVAEKWAGPDLDEASSPLFVPDRHCPLIIWQTLIHVKSIYDRGDAPAFWTQMHEIARMAFFKENMARPIAKRARIRLPDAPMLRPLI